MNLIASYKVLLLQEPVIAHDYGLMAHDDEF